MRLILRIVAVLGLVGGLAVAAFFLFLQGLEYGTPIVAFAYVTGGLAWFLLFWLVADIHLQTERTHSMLESLFRRFDVFRREQEPPGPPD